ncbi:hypothetical protein Malapachy_3871 [Malassezia pachydermatis]|uniref:Uncharacterized protein n=1 Tax=Malassezia pachydermatis TaxID=77020 RepID=A0A0M8MUG8_9BASI|nr:hypothetical protein Malapachy_3871 [Malassezia pachydermatis]KOS14030.1 hypothetical protein Malapachy_3871 [Malassezia pachydermatis]
MDERAAKAERARKQLRRHREAQRRKREEEEVAAAAATAATSVVSAPAATETEQANDVPPLPPTETTAEDEPSTQAYASDLWSSYQDTHTTETWSFDQLDPADPSDDPDTVPAVAITQAAPPKPPTDEQTEAPAANELFSADTYEWDVGEDASAAAPSTSTATEMPDENPVLWLGATPTRAHTSQAHFMTNLYAPSPKRASSINNFAEDFEKHMHMQSSENLVPEEPAASSLFDTGDEAYSEHATVYEYTPKQGFDETNAYGFTEPSEYDAYYDQAGHEYDYDPAAYEAYPADAEDPGYAYPTEEEYTYEAAPPTEEAASVEQAYTYDDGPPAEEAALVDEAYAYDEGPPAEEAEPVEEAYAYDAAASTKEAEPVEPEAAPMTYDVPPVEEEAAPTTDPYAPPQERTHDDAVLPAENLFEASGATSEAFALDDPEASEALPGMEQEDAGPTSWTLPKAEAEAGADTTVHEHDDMPGTEMSPIPEEPADTSKEVRCAELEEENAQLRARVQALTEQVARMERDFATTLDQLVHDHDQKMAAMRQERAAATAEAARLPSKVLPRVHKRSATTTLSIVQDQTHRRVASAVHEAHEAHRAHPNQFSQDALLFCSCCRGDFIVV